MKSFKKRQPRKARSIEALTAILSCKGGAMRARQARRAKDAKHNQICEGWYNTKAYRLAARQTLKRLKMTPPRA
jgi:hypothetical protein